MTKFDDIKVGDKAELIHIITQLEHYFGDDFEGYELQVYVKRLMEHTLPKSIF